jgi:hypothetical protein
VRASQTPAWATWMMRHYWIWALLSGALLTGWIELVVGNWVLGLIVGVSFGVVNGVAWRPGGPARRLRSWVERRYPPRS